MARETWAVYSVRDHLAPYAFVTDVLLYDRVRVPVPSDDDRERWVGQGWEPERQARLLAVLGDRARPIEWSADLREYWRSNYQAARRSASETQPDAFQYTRMQLIDSLPRAVTGIDTVCGYQHFDDLRDDAQVARLDEPDAHPGLVAASIAWDFAVPAQVQQKPPQVEAELEMLAAAVAVSNRKAYRHNRRAYWRWVREFSDGTVTGPEAVAEAVEELQDLVEEQHQLVRDVWVDRAVRTGFLLATVTLGLLAAPLAPVTLAGAAVSIGGFTWTELGSRRQAGGDRETKVAAMFCQIDQKIRRRLFDDK